MSWLNIMTLLTHFFYWWKGYVFVVTKIIFFFGYTSRYFVYRVRSSTTLWLPYCSFRSSCKITAIVGLFERLLLRTAVHSFIHSPPLPIFFLDPSPWWFFAPSSSILFFGIFYTIHTLNEDQIVGRSFIKTGISQRDEIGFNSEVFLM